MVQFTFQIMESIAIYVTSAYFLTAYAFELIVHYHDIMVYLSFGTSLVNPPPSNFFCFWTCKATFSSSFARH